MNIAKKVSVVPNDMSVWRRSVTEQDPAAGCVCITRPKDGRLTIARPDHNSTKKVFPQVLLCQAFRWPYIFFHSDIKSADNCKYQTVIKPPEKETGDVGELICINPYHYVITPEAQARFKRQGKSSDSGPTGGQRKRTPKKAGSKPAAASQAAAKATAATTTTTTQGKQLQSVKDEGFSESEPLDFDDEGIDYVKMWKERRISPEKKGFQKFDENEILKEIEFMNIKNKAIHPEVKQKLVEEIRKNILSGDYIKGYIKNHYEPGKDDPKRPAAATPKKTDSIRMSSEDQEDSNMSEDAPPPKTTAKANQQPSAAGTGGGPPEESAAIQDLLDDIQGSYERQFDDEFENLSAADLEAAAAAAANAGEPTGQPESMQFPNMDSATFNDMVTNFGESSAVGSSSQAQQPQQQPYGHPPTHQAMYDPRSAAMINPNMGLPLQPSQPPANSPPAHPHHVPASTSATVDNPCIVNSWTLGSQGPSPSYVSPVHSDQPYGDYYSRQQQQQPPAGQPQLHHQDMMYGGGGGGHQQQQQYDPHYQYQGYNMPPQQPQHPGGGGYPPQ